MSAHRPTHTGHELSRARAHEGDRAHHDVRADTPSTEAMAELLPDLSYPADKAAVVACARSHKVDHRLVDRLAAMPEDEFKGAGDISRALSRMH